VSAPRPSAGRPPSGTLPLRYLVAATVAFALATGAVPWLARELAGHYYHPRLLALTHTVTLGWITLTIMGATYQLVPIVFERPVWSERVARWQFVSVVTGVAGMVAHFAIGRWPGLLWSATLLALGVALHLLNVTLSLRGLVRWTLTARLMALALAGLGATTVFGALLAVDRVWKVLPGALLPTLHAHFHLALLGWVMPIVLGVSARVYPMFMLAAEPGGWPGRVQLWGVAAGAPLVVVGLLALPALVPVGALAVAAAALAHARWTFALARARRRPALDWGLRLALAAVAFLLPATALGLALAFDLAGGPRWSLAYAVLALGGWVSLTIAGMMWKIVPFLVWYRVYAPRVGREPVPTLAQLSWPAAEGAAACLLTGGMLALAAALLAGEAAWIRAAGALVTLGALAFVTSLARVLHHLAPCATRRRGPVPARAAAP
jgi:hypothetical protein